MTLCFHAEALLFFDPVLLIVHRKGTFFFFLFYLEGMKYITKIKKLLRNIYYANVLKRVPKIRTRYFWDSSELQELGQQCDTNIQLHGSWKNILNMRL